MFIGFSLDVFYRFEQVFTGFQQFSPVYVFAVIIITISSSNTYMYIYRERETLSLSLSIYIYISPGFVAPGCRAPNRVVLCRTVPD